MHIAAVSNYSIQLWNVETGELEAASERERLQRIASNFVAFSPDGKYIIAKWEHYSGWIFEFWTVDMDVPALKLLKLRQDLTHFVSFSPHGGYIASGTDDARAIRICHNSELTQQIDYDLAVAQATSLHQYPNGSVVRHWREGWLRYYPSDELMFWVPFEFRSGLYSPGVVNILGVLDNTKIELSQFVHGADCLKCQKKA